jgi:hypothetical protein
MPLPTLTPVQVHGLSVSSTYTLESSRFITLKTKASWEIAGLARSEQDVLERLYLSE